MALFAIITEEQYDQINGAKYNDSSYFYPQKEMGGSWCISAEEIRDCVNPDLSWVNELGVTEIQLKVELELPNLSVNEHENE